MAKKIKYRASDNDRIDTVVYRYYGTLEPLEKVISLNAHLEPVLKSGDIIILPAYSGKPKVAKLW